MRSYSLPPIALRYRWFLLLTVLLALVAVLPIAQRAERQSQGQRRGPLQGPREQSKTHYPNAVPGEILVRFRPESKAKRLGAQVVTEKTGRQIAMSIRALNPSFELLEGLRVAKVDPSDTSRAIEALRARPDVIYAEPNYIRRALVAPNDPRYPEMWGLHNTGQASTDQGNSGIAGNDIRAEQAWAVTTGSRNVVVGVIDTGIDINHEDLKDNIWVNPGEIAGNGVDDDANGFIDDVNGWDFAHNDATVFDYTPPSYPPDDDYTGDFDDHGTHVAGTIGAHGNNGKGVAGVNWQVSLMSLKFLTDEAGAGTTEDLVKAYAYAKLMKQLWVSSGGTKGANIRVLNNSYGGFEFSQTEQDAIRELNDAGILFVVAAGNENNFNDQFPVYPSNYISPNLISVAASTGVGTRAFFSNWGEATVNVTAPGEHILSTTPKNTYFFADGTSMAAPHVSGSAALVCAQFPNITLQKLRSVMMYSGYAAPWQFNNILPISTGRAIDAGNALQSVNSPDVTAPGAVTNLSAQIGSGFPNYTISMQAPGDDGNVGKITAYELRFSDTSLNDANWDLGKPLAGPKPNDPGIFQTFSANIPWRHPSGFIGVRAVDDVGNKGPITSVPILVDAGVGDPYVMSETAPAPVSTGGTPLNLIGDDSMKSINLPFVFKFYGNDYNSVTVSTNGALYFGFPPSNDAFNHRRFLNGRTMIAGLWDDLRTDKREGDDVYTVQDAERIIFRWKAVTFDTPISPGVKRGENPVSFEIELKFDGTITIRYADDSNQKLFPVVGLGGGWPEPYFVPSHTSEFDLKDLTNAATVVFTRRDPVQRPVLTVASLNPSSGVDITVSPNDISGAGNGATQFTRTYNPGTSVTLTAPATVNGGGIFQRWLRNGVDWSGNRVTSFVMGTSSFTMTAVYNPPPVLTVTSTNPNAGVAITVTPNDNNGSGDGTTPFTRTYNQNTGVNLTAPQTVGTNTFWKWQVNGVDYVQSQFASVTLDANKTVTAIYVSASPTPTPTPVPGAGAQPIAFVKSGSGGGSDVFLTNLDGTNVVNITDAAGDDAQPAWSPDGSRFAYTCLRQPDGSIGQPQRICIRNADGTGFVVLSNTLAQDASPSWSPDGTQIVFTTSAGFGPPMLSIMNADGTGRFPIGAVNVANPSFSPNGSTIVFGLNNSSIWTLNRTTQLQLQISSAADSRPRYSPDGSKIVFQSFRDSQAEIYVMNADGSGQTRLTNNPAFDTAPAWSPDGTKILFTSLRDDPMTPALYVMNADGSNQTRVTAGSDGVWRPVASTPVIFTEQGTGNAAAINSVTYVRGPFKILDPHNFSADGHTRITVFTSSLGLVSPPIPQTSTLSVQANGVNLPVEYVGTATGVPGMNGSYIIVRLPDGLPTGDLSLTITLRGVTSQAGILQIVP